MLRVVPALPFRRPRERKSPYRGVLVGSRRTRPYKRLPVTRGLNLRSASLATPYILRSSLQYVRRTEYFVLLRYILKYQKKRVQTTGVLFSTQVTTEMSMLEPVGLSVHLIHGSSAGEQSVGKTLLCSYLVLRTS